MKAELLLLMIISAMLMAATKIYAYEGATHDAIAPMKDTTGKYCGLDFQGRWHDSHQRQREWPAGFAWHPHP